MEYLMRFADLKIQDRCKCLWSSFHPKEIEGIWQECVRSHEINSTS